MSELATINEILTKRKERASVLGQLVERSSKQRAELLNLHQLLIQVDGGDKFSEVLPQLAAEIDSFHRKAARLQERLNSDYLTFALVGLEKAGKSTFINNFAGLFLNPDDRSSGGYLPSGETRCTASIAELRNNTSNTFDVVYYSAQEMIDEIINPMLRLVKLPEIINKKQIGEIRLDDHTFGAYPEIKERLQKIKECASLLTEDERIEANKSVTPEGLAQYLSHESTEKKLPLVKKCVIYRPLADSAAQIRFIDTPGINDPNPNAKQKTLSIVKKEADIIIMASRPVKPSLENNDAAFLDELYQSFSGIEQTGQKIVWLMNTYCVPKDQNYSQHKLDINKRTHHTLADRIHKCDFQNDDLTHLVNNLILSHAQRTLPIIDEQEMKQIQGDYTSLLESLSSLANNILERYQGETIDQEALFFDEQFRDWYEQFTEALTQLPERSADYTEFNTFALNAFKDWSSNLPLPSEEDWNKWSANHHGIGSLLAEDFIYHTFKFLRELCDDYSTVLAEEIQEDVVEFFDTLGCAGIYAPAETLDSCSKLISLRDACKNLKAAQKDDLVNAFTDLINLKTSLQHSLFDRLHTYLSELRSFELSKASLSVNANKINELIRNTLTEMGTVETGEYVIGLYTDKLVKNILNVILQGQIPAIIATGFSWVMEGGRAEIEELDSQRLTKSELTKLNNTIAKAINDKTWVSSEQKVAVRDNYKSWISYIEASVNHLGEVITESLSDATYIASFAFTDFITQVGTLNARFKSLNYPLNQAHAMMIRTFIHSNRDKLGFLTESEAAEQMRIFREIQKSCENVKAQ